MRLPRALAWLSILAPVTVELAGAQSSPVRAPTVLEKSARVSVLSGPTPHIDGLLDDPAWARVTPIVDFVQKEPREGAPPSEATELWLTYDDHALYVAARMHRADPQSIRRAVTRRDGDSDAEVLVVSLDTYLDRRTAYSFALSSGGVRKDYYHSQDSEDGAELTFDPVWQGRVHIDSAGWTAEMRIPFSQLRFTKKEDQVWGLQVKRAMPDKNETDYWVLIPKAATGFPSHFGYLNGIAGIRPARRIELVPYTTGDLTLKANVDAASPFNAKTGARAGADLKMGLGPNLTLDAAVNPDFGQVEADPAEVNLTAFETVFDERRPFFVEGNELLRGRGLSFLGRPTWFYSRRIGAPPHGSAVGDFIKSPPNTTILGATKVTGRLASGLSIGAMGAVTPRENARTYSLASGEFGDVAVEPAAAFGVVRVQQEVGREHSVLGWTVTNVNRSLGGAGNLHTLLVREAASVGTDWRFRFRQGMYEFTGWAGASRIAGDAPAIARVMRSRAHYFQRPDQDYASYDTTRTSLTGYTAGIRGDKNAGRWTVWGISLATRSPGFEINDLGQLRRGDDIAFGGDFQLRDTEPHKRMRYWQVGHSFGANWNYGGTRRPVSLSQNISLTFPNFWRWSFRTNMATRGLSDDLTRGGPLMQTARAWSWSTTLQNQTQATWYWSGTAAWGFDELDGRNWQVSGGLTLRPAPRWQAQVSPRYSRSVDARQYVFTRTGGPTVTYGSRYIFSHIERSTIAASLRLNYALTPDFTLEGYAEPFAASGRFYDFGELSAPRSRALRTYGTAPGTTITRQLDGSSVVTDGASTFTIGDLDFDQLSFRSNLVLRWEWARGSTLFFIWQQNRRDATTEGQLVRPGSLLDATTAPGDNFLAVKLTYWIAAR
jgi:hypothetical protein